MISEELQIERLKREMKAAMKKGENEFECQIYKWLGQIMRIKITDNRILCGYCAKISLISNRNITKLR